MENIVREGFKKYCKKEISEEIEIRKLVKINSSDAVVNLKEKVEK